MNFIIENRLNGLITANEINDAVHALVSDFQANSPNDIARNKYYNKFSTFAVTKIQAEPPLSPEIINRYMAFFHAASKHKELKKLNIRLLILNCILKNFPTDDRAINNLLSYFKYYNELNNIIEFYQNNFHKNNDYTIFIKLTSLLKKNEILSQELLLKCIKKIYFSAKNKNHNENFLAFITQCKNEQLIEKKTRIQLQQFLVSLFDKPLSVKIRHLIDEQQKNSLLPQQHGFFASAQSEPLDQCSDENAEKLNGILRQTHNGFGEISSNSDSAAPFILAAIRQQKESTYPFLPTIILKNNYNEDFLSYLECIASMPPPVQERFLLAHNHWMCGEIQVDIEGNVKIFILDSSGSFNCPMSQFEEHLSRIFKNKKIEIYFSLDDRQYSNMGCSVFALDDLRHFYTIDRYAEQKTLFQQLDEREDVVKAENPVDNVTIKYCHLPDSLLRTMQKDTLLDISKESTVIVNKKGETFSQSSRKGFNTLEKNKRLEKKLKKMALRLDKCINDCLKDDANAGYAKLCAMANEHTLPAFLNRADTMKHKNTFKKVLKEIEQKNEGDSKNPGFHPPHK